uniref:GTPase, IMAP family member 5 n=1 Tax=Aquila chrysaetos chrysaetos TaxID=223781 RepID=A0A663FFH0_AQUCH
GAAKGLRRGLGMRLLLVGKSGAGKSATSNTLLGECVFKFATELVIVSCVQAQGCCDGEDITVIDAADIFDPKAAISEVYKEITHCIRLSSPGPHVLLLGTNLGQSIEEDKEAVQRLQDIFGVDVLRSLHNYLRYCGNGALQDLILRCGSRYCGFNNRAVGAEQDHQVTKLMGMVCYVVQENGGEWYSNDMYLEPSLMEEKVEYHMGRYKAERKMREWSRPLPICQMFQCPSCLCWTHSSVSTSIWHTEPSAPWTHATLQPQESSCNDHMFPREIIN